jgi:hypothetical protein
MTCLVTNRSVKIRNMFGRRKKEIFSPIQSSTIPKDVIKEKIN